LAFIQFIVQFSKVIVVITACRGDLFILTNSEELVKDVFLNFFSKLNSILKCQGLRPNSLFSISHYVVLSRTKF
ncbi:hypothetical protein, partial [uncultured Megasphaera sp.]|uniref:hypothetical protein n=1 Tax=uncultured Megasphaera sp. TaxID=165188 RepID=UPI002625F943